MRSARTVVPAGERVESYWRLFADLDGDTGFLVDLLALMPYCVRVTEAQRHADSILAQIPRQRTPHPRDVTTPGAVVSLWPVRKGVRHPPTAGGRM